MKKIIQTLPTTDAISQGVIAGDTVFISGQIGSDPISGKLISSSIEVETKQVMENIKLILIEAKISFQNVSKSTIFLTDMNDLEQVNKVYGSYFQDKFPACEVFEATGLQLNAHVEISMIAFK